MYTSDEHLVTVDVDTSDGFEVSVPRNLFELPENVRPESFDLTSDGERTIWIEWNGLDVTKFVVVLNWAGDID